MVPLARLTLEVRIGADGRLFKSAAPGKAAVTLEKMIVTLTSGKLVVCDTVTAQGSRLSREPAYLSPTATYPQSLLLRYELKPDRIWTATVQVLDAQDSVRFAGVLELADMDAYEYLDGCLPVEPRYGVFETRLRLPNAVEADGIPGSARALRILYFDRIDLLVDGHMVMERLPGTSPAGIADVRFQRADTNRLALAGDTRFFRPTAENADAPMVLSYDYVGLTTSQFTVEAYGYVEGDTLGVTPERLLYRGSQGVDIFTAKVSVDEPVDMVWQAVDVVPSGTTATGVEVRLGRAGKVVMNVIVPGGVVL